MLEGSILQKLDEAHHHSPQPLNLGVYYKNTLVALCHALEDFVLDSRSAPLMITAFQRGKWYLEEADRYSDLADKSEQVILMATPDAGFDTHPTSQKKNVALVQLKPEDPVAEEWHLIILSPTYTAMVLCQELSPEDYGEQLPKTDLERKFYGFWTFEPKLVQETVDLAISHVQKYDAQLAELIIKTVTQMNAESANRQRDDLDTVVAQVIKYLQDSHKILNQPAESINFIGFQDLRENIISNEMQAYLRMAQLLDATDVSNPMAASEVAAMAEAMSQLLDLPAWQAKRLYLSGLLHRVGLPDVTREYHKRLDSSEGVASRHEVSPLGQPDRSSAKRSPYQAETLANNSAPKASVLRIMPQLEAVCKILTHQREAWDGSGIPAGLAYDQIPLESRIICLLADFQQKMKAYKQYSTDKNPIVQALKDCQALAGKRYDPKLLEALSLMVMVMQQGMSLDSYQPKIASGMWLVNSGDETQNSSSLA